MARGRANTLRRLLARARRGSRSARPISPRLRFEAEGVELLLSPHLDDAVLSCWSVLTGGRSVRVANLFAGAPAPGRSGAWELVAGVRDSAERALLRIEEDRRALALARARAVNLALLDEQYRRGERSTAGLAEIDRALAQAGFGGVSRVYAPAGIGGHSDHLLARSYARCLLATGIPVTLYADVPYCFQHGWPPWVDGREPSPRRNVEAYWHSFLEQVPEMPALDAGDVERLGRAPRRAKVKAVRCYETSLGYGMRHLLGEAEFAGFEVRWALRAGGATAARRSCARRAARDVSHGQAARARRALTLTPRACRDATSTRRDSGVAAVSARPWAPASREGLPRLLFPLAASPPDRRQAQAREPSWSCPRSSAASSKPRCSRAVAQVAAALVNGSHRVTTHIGAWHSPSRSAACC